MAIINIGVDIGQKRDPTAIAVVELEDERSDRWRAQFLERLALGTPYPKVVERLTAIVQKLREPRLERAPNGYSYRNAAPHVLSLYVDATGVGQPVMDLLAAAGVDPIPVYFTHGDRRNEAGGQISLGKAWLASRLQALIQTGRLSVPSTDEARALVKELLDYEIHVDARANDTYGAFKIGTHDDLVTALGLAVQEAPQFITRMGPGDPLYDLWTRR